MGNKGLQRLAILLTKNADPSWINDDLYRMLWCEELYHMAEQRQKSKKGASPGTDGTAMRVGTEEVTALIGELREQRFTLAEDRSSQHLKREDLVGDVLEIILRAIYDGPKNPTLKDTAFGWRTESGRHAALRTLSLWKDVQWFIEGSVVGCLTRNQLHILDALLKQRIHDGRFLDLLWKLLAVKPLDFSAILEDLFPQILLRIYLHPLDCFVETLSQQTNTAHSLHYIRHANEWRIGICGSKQFAEDTSAQITDFLQQNLALTHSILAVQPACKGTLFLGCQAKSPENHLTSRSLRLLAPIDRIIQRLALQGICDYSGQPQPKSSWTHQELPQIVGRFNRILKGYLDYYCFAHNRRQLRQVQYILQHSAARTLAQKLKLSVRKVFRLFGPELAVTPHTALALNQDWRQQPRIFLLGDDEPGVSKWIPLT